MAWKKNVPESGKRETAVIIHREQVESQFKQSYNLPYPNLGVEPEPLNVKFRLLPLPGGASRYLKVYVKVNSTRSRS